MTAKYLFQELWQIGIDWDESIPAPFQDTFANWVEGIKVIKEWEIPRCFFQSHWGNLEGMELHSFGDASSKGYEAVLYIRKPNPDGTYQISFVIAKTKVAPLKKVTLPQLEWLGSLLAARLHVFCLISTHLPQFINYKCWTDSTVALSWIKGRPGRWIKLQRGGWWERFIHFELS